MKENNEDVGATAFDLPNSQYPYVKPTFVYGNQSVPHPTNAAAKIVNSQAIVDSFTKGR